ncbi:MAG: hypothetical protein J3R72DRAFT_522604 [Linnemannia gamsii]|nr:MAG: hypothetical protein J3R72DRAFT_522604 [Linnemannia gamsii]
MPSRPPSAAVVLDDKDVQTLLDMFMSSREISLEDVKVVEKLLNTTERTIHLSAVNIETVTLTSIPTSGLFIHPTITTDKNLEQDHCWRQYCQGVYHPGRMELVVCLSTILFARGPWSPHKEKRYGVDGFKNRPSVQAGARINYPCEARECMDGPHVMECAVTAAGESNVSMAEDLIDLMMIVLMRLGANLGDEFYLIWSIVTG